MINNEMYELGVKPSAIRNLFEYGKQRKSLIGEENVFDFSLGNPNVPSPKIVNDTLTKLINELDPTVLHGYTSAVGDNNVRNAIASYLNKTYNANIDSSLIYMTVGAAAALGAALPISNAVPSPVAFSKRFIILSAIFAPIIIPTISLATPPPPPEPEPILLPN